MTGAAPNPSTDTTFDVVTRRTAYAKGALSALGAASVLAALSIVFGVPPIDASFSIDQIIWAVGILIFLLSLRDFAIALAAFALGPVLVFRFEDAGVRIGGSGAPPIPWPRIVAIAIRRDDDVDILAVHMRGPATPLSWIMSGIYGLRAEQRGAVIGYGIRCERVGLTEAALREGLLPFAERLPQSSVPG